MKTTINLLLAVIMTAFCCSIANAQYSNALVNATLIYSNAFDGNGSVNITNTQPDYSSGLYGGSNGVNAAWMDLGGSAHTNYFYANGTLGSPQGDTVVLPFTPVTNHVYALYITYTTSGSLSTWVAGGFDGFYVDGAPSNRNQFNSGGTAGYDWMLENYNSSSQFFLGAGTGSGITGPFNAVAGVNHTMLVVLDTTFFENPTNMWIATCYNDGQLVGKQIYSATPPIRSVGYGLNGMTVNLEHNVTWNSFILSANQELIVQQPVSAAVNVATAFTNSVVVGGTPPFFYQWYNNNAPIANATNASLIFNSVATSNGGTDYYVIVTNVAFGAVTSAVASLTVYTNPVFATAYPVTYTNLTTFYGATNVGGTNYVGATPTFSVSTVGGQPITYQWLTNGVAVGGATGTKFTFTNCPLNGPTNFACIAANSYGTTTNAWSVSYLQSPMASFPAAILSNNPVGFWRLNEGLQGIEDGNGDDGVIALDYVGGNNGIYSNADFTTTAGYTNSGYTNVGSVLYNNTDPGDSSVLFNFAGAHSDAFGIQGIDFSTNGGSATFTVQAWAKGPAAQVNGACLIAKGYNGGEQFALDVNGNKWRFLYRNASGGVPAVTASTGPDGSWHLVVGVVDQVNGNISLYVDGLLAASAAVTAGSGVLTNSAAVTIGARGASATDSDSAQFSGYLSDVVAYKTALTSGQVANMWIAAGGTTGFVFVPPLPPTNVVFLANGTLTIPATIFGPAPMGYYWTNVTTSGIVGSGRTNVFGNMVATLIIPNAPASLSGDLLELVVTNAASFTNSFTTLFSPALPIPLGYSNPILYSNYFNGGLWSIAGVPLTAANLLVGGTNATWIDVLGTNDTGRLQGNGTPSTAQGDSWLLPFTPEPGYVYTINASVTFSGNPGNWVGLGFAQTIPTNSTSSRFTDAPNGYDWLILTEGTGNIQYFPGPSTSVATVTNANAFFPAGTGTNTVQIILDTTGAQWVMYAYVDGVSAGTNTYSSNPSISGVGITQNALSVPGTVQWNYFALTQVAPGGVPPYIFNPLPPTSVTLLADTSLSIPASAFGSVPIGYYWSNTNTAAVLGSGATNNVAPLSANLIVADVPGSWNGNTLALIVTNAYGTNISLVTLTVTNSILIPTNTPTITGFSLVSGTNVLISATNGQSGYTYYLLGSTNLITPLSQWLPVATNVILTNGGSANGFTFSGTNVVHVSNPQQFYFLSNTN